MEGGGANYLLYFQDKILVGCYLFNPLFPRPGFGPVIAKICTTSPYLKSFFSDIHPMQDNDAIAKQVEHHLEALVELMSIHIRPTVITMLLFSFGCSSANARQISPSLLTILAINVRRG